MIDPPSNLLLPVPKPEYRDTSYAYTFDYIEQMWAALDSCNGRLKDIKLFVEEVKKEKAP